MCLSLFNESLQWTTTCNNQGKCELTYANDNNTKVYIKPGYLHKYPEKGAEIIRMWNKTYEQIHISKQIDGISPYGLLKGKIGYECSGGLSECFNSCCLNGFCVEILYYCNQQRENIKQIYIVTCSGFLFLICIYWVTFFVIGCSYNRVMEKKENRNKTYHEKANSIPIDFVYNQSINQTDREQFDTNDNYDRRLITLNNNRNNNNLNEQSNATDSNPNSDNNNNNNESKLRKLNWKSLMHQLTDVDKQDSKNENTNTSINENKKEEAAI